MKREEAMEALFARRIEQKAKRAEAFLREFKLIKTNLVVSSVRIELRKMQGRTKFRKILYWH